VGNLETGKPLEYAVRAEVETGKHLFEGVASDVAAEFAVAIRSGLRQYRAGAFVDTDRYPQIGCRLVYREVVSARECPAAKLVGAPEDPHQA
jgi:hypothetical protein